MSTAYFASLPPLLLFLFILIATTTTCGAEGASLPSSANPNTTTDSAAEVHHVATRYYSNPSSSLWTADDTYEWPTTISGKKGRSWITTPFTRNSNGVFSIVSPLQQQQQASTAHRTGDSKGSSGTALSTNNNDDAVAVAAAGGGGSGANNYLPCQLNNGCVCDHSLPYYDAANSQYYGTCLFCLDARFTGPTCSHLVVHCDNLGAYNSTTLQCTCPSAVVSSMGSTTSTSANPTATATSSASSTAAIIASPWVGPTCAQFTCVESINGTGPDRAMAPNPITHACDACLPGRGGFACELCQSDDGCNNDDELSLRSPHLVGSSLAPDPATTNAASTAAAQRPFMCAGQQDPAPFRFPATIAPPSLMRSSTAGTKMMSSLRAFRTAAAAGASGASASPKNTVYDRLVTAAATTKTFYCNASSDAWLVRTMMGSTASSTVALPPPDAMMSVTCTSPSAFSSLPNHGYSDGRCAVTALRTAPPAYGGMAPFFYCTALNCSLADVITLHVEKGAQEKKDAALRGIKWFGQISLLVGSVLMSLARYIPVAPRWQQHAVRWSLAFLLTSLAVYIVTVAVLMSASPTLQRRSVSYNCLESSCDCAPAPWLLDSSSVTPQTRSASSTPSVRSASAATPYPACTDTALQSLVFPVLQNVLNFTCDADSMHCQLVAPQVPFFNINMSCTTGGCLPRNATTATGTGSGGSGSGNTGPAAAALTPLETGLIAGAGSVLFIILVHWVWTVWRARGYRQEFLTSQLAEDLYRDHTGETEARWAISSPPNIRQASCSSPLLTPQDSTVVDSDVLPPPIVTNSASSASERTPLVAAITVGSTTPPLAPHHHDGNGNGNGNSGAGGPAAVTSTTSSAMCGKRADTTTSSDFHHSKTQSFGATECTSGGQSSNSTTHGGNTAPPQQPQHRRYNSVGSGSSKPPLHRRLPSDGRHSAVNRSAHQHTSAVTPLAVEAADNGHTNEPLLDSHKHALEDDPEGAGMGQTDYGPTAGGGGMGSTSQSGGMGGLQWAAGGHHSRSGSSAFSLGTFGSGPASPTSPASPSPLHGPQTCVLHVEDLGYAVRSSPWPPFVLRPSNTRAILSGVNLHATSGDVIALMGSSGAGKTTLLDILAARDKSGTLSGRIMLNGAPISRRAGTRGLYRGVVGYVAQEDTLLPDLTVWETVHYAARLKLPSAFSPETVRSIVTDVLASLRLLKCSQTILGDGQTTRGVSGGEKRRVSIAVELVSNPRILFLDEPTSGLDASNARQVMEVLRTLATSSPLRRHAPAFFRFNPIIIASIHQPSPAVFRGFTKVLLLSQGRAVYFGDTGRAAVNILRTLAEGHGGTASEAHLIADDGLSAPLLEASPHASTHSRTQVPPPPHREEEQDTYSDAENGAADEAPSTTNTTPALLAAPDHRRVHSLGGLCVSPELLDTPAEFLLSVDSMDQLLRDRLADVAAAESRAVTSAPASLANSTTNRPVGAGSGPDAAAMPPPRAASKRSLRALLAASPPPGSPTASSGPSSADVREAGEAFLRQIQSARRYYAHPYAQTLLLIQRAHSSLMGAYYLVSAHGLVAFVVGILMIRLYQSEPLDLPGALNRAGSVTFLLLVQAFTSLSVLEQLLAERRLFVTERENGYYSTLPYFVSKVVIDVFPLRVVPATVLSALIYFPMGLRTDSGAHFLWFVGIVALFTCCITMMVVCIGLVSRSFGAAGLVASVVILWHFVFGGLLVQAETIPAAFEPFKKISPFYFCFESLLTNELDGQQCQFAPSNDAGQASGILVGVPCVQYLYNLGLDPARFTTDVLLLALETAVLACLAAFLMTFVSLSR